MGKGALAPCPPSCIVILDGGHVFALPTRSLKVSLMSEPDVKNSRVALLGVPIEIGASQRGTLMGPDALRTAGIGRVLEQLEFCVEDHGNLAISADVSDGASPPANAKYYDEIKTWIRALSERAWLLARSGAVPI